MLESKYGDIWIAYPDETYSHLYWLEPPEEYYVEEHCEYGGSIKFTALKDDIESGFDKIIVVLEKHLP